MQKHNTSRLHRVSEIDSEKLSFKLTSDQRARVPRGEYNWTNSKTGKRRARSAATHLLGIIWDDDPEWVYETDLTKSSIAERRREACANTLKPSRLTVGNMWAFQVIDQQERGLKEPRSLAQLAHEVGSSLEVGLRWLRKLDFCKEAAASAR